MTRKTSLTTTATKAGQTARTLNLDAKAAWGSTWYELVRDGARVSRRAKYHLAFIQGFEQEKNS